MFQYYASKNNLLKKHARVKRGLGIGEKRHMQNTEYKKAATAAGVIASSVAFVLIIMKLVADLIRCRVCLHP